MILSANSLAAQKGDTQVRRPGGSTQNATTAILSKSLHFPKPGLPLPSMQTSLSTRRVSTYEATRAQLENNLVYSDRLQSMLTLGGGPCWVLQPLHQAYNFMVIEPEKLPLSPGQ